MLPRPPWPVLHPLSSAPKEERRSADSGSNVGLVSSGWSGPSSPSAFRLFWRSKERPPPGVRAGLRNGLLPPSPEPAMGDDTAGAAGAAGTAGTAPAGKGGTGDPGATGADTAPPPLLGRPPPPPPPKPLPALPRLPRLSTLECIPPLPCTLARPASSAAKRVAAASKVSLSTTRQRNSTLLPRRRE